LLKNVAICVAELKRTKVCSHTCNYQQNTLNKNRQKPCTRIGTLFSYSGNLGIDIHVTVEVKDLKPLITFYNLPAKVLSLKQAAATTF
jgi:hypothetical protein